MKKVIGIACIDGGGFYASASDEALPWPHTESDLDWFRYLTNGGIVVVGNNSYKELQKLPPLKNREIWPVGKEHELKSVEDVMEKFSSLSDNRNLFIGGGKGLWEGFGDYYDNFYLTVLNKSYLTEGLSLYGKEDMKILNDYPNGTVIIEKENYKVYKFKSW